MSGLLQHCAKTFAAAKPVEPKTILLKKLKLQNPCAKLDRTASRVVDACEGPFHAAIKGRFPQFGRIQTAYNGSD